MEKNKKIKFFMTPKEISTFTAEEKKEYSKIVFKVYGNFFSVIYLLSAMIVSGFTDSFEVFIYLFLCFAILNSKIFRKISSYRFLEFLKKRKIKIPIIILLTIFSYSRVLIIGEVSNATDFIQNKDKHYEDIEQFLSKNEFSEARSVIWQFKSDVCAHISDKEDCDKLQAYYDDIDAKIDAQKKRENQKKIEVQKREAKARALPSGEFNHYSDGSGANRRVTYEQYQYACSKANLSTYAIKGVGVWYSLVNELYYNNPNSVSNIKVFWSDQGRCVATFFISGMLKGTQYSKKVVGYAESFYNQDGKIFVNSISQPYLQ